MKMKIKFKGIILEMNSDYTLTSWPTKCFCSATPRYNITKSNFLPFHIHIHTPPPLPPCAVRKFRYGCKRNRIITIKNLVMTKSLTKKLLLLLL